MNSNIKEIDVFTDNESIWISERDLIQISRKIPIEKLMAFDISYDYKFDKTEPFIKVGLDLLKFIRNNNPTFKAHVIMVESKKNKSQKEEKGKSR